eukprot:10222254-Alexandrium_andersonii.AAC.1
MPARTSNVLVSTIFPRTVGCLWNTGNAHPSGGHASPLDRAASERLAHGSGRGFEGVMPMLFSTL